MRANPSACPSPLAKATAPGVLAPVGVIRKLAPLKMAGSAFHTPPTSRPAMGWQAINSTPGGKSACTGPTTAPFTPHTSVSSVPGRRCAACARTHSTMAPG